MTRSSSFDMYVLLQFEAGLREQQRELQQTIDRMERDIRDLADFTADDMDFSCCNATKESMAARNSRNCGKLRLIELALERIQDGSFGTCIACGDAIDLRRLQAIPSASYCIECQERLEQDTLNAVTRSIPMVDGEFIRNSTW